MAIVLHRLPIPQTSTEANLMALSRQAIDMAEHYQHKYEALLHHVQQWAAALDNIDTNDVTEYSDQVHLAERNLRAAAELPLPDEVLP
jgi:hypothetical protein